MQYINNENKIIKFKIFFGKIENDNYILDFNNRYTNKKLSFNIIDTYETNDMISFELTDDMISQIGEGENYLYIKSEDISDIIKFDCL